MAIRTTASLHWPVPDLGTIAGRLDRQADGIRRPKASCAYWKEPVAEVLVRWP
jgi:hypothetical protein